VFLKSLDIWLIVNKKAEAMIIENILRVLCPPAII